jgi:hypothetical protein
MDSVSEDKFEEGQKDVIKDMKSFKKVLSTLNLNLKKGPDTRKISTRDSSRRYVIKN